MASILGRLPRGQLRRLRLRVLAYRLTKPLAQADVDAYMQALSSAITSLEDAIVSITCNFAHNGPFITQLHIKSEIRSSDPFLVRRWTDSEEDYCIFELPSWCK